MGRETDEKGEDEVRRRKGPNGASWMTEGEGKGDEEGGGG